MIDAHLHFWKYDPLAHDWIGNEMAVIRQDFLPEQLSAVFTAHGISGGVAVQVEQSEKETDFLLKLSRESELIKGVVGWIDLQSPLLSERLDFYSQFDILKGFRHILQAEAQRDLCLQPDFLKGIALLEQFGFTYDILVFADQLKYIPELAARFPNQRFVLDHIAKPMIRTAEISSWKKDIQKVALLENVSCKVSGMVTEADLKNWKPADFTPYLDVVVQTFGVKRVMYGSDWPVCLAAGSYSAVLELVKNYFSAFSATEQDLFFSHNATDFYQL